MKSNKKDYIKPELKSHGQLKDITLGDPGGLGDSENADDGGAPWNGS